MDFNLCQPISCESELDSRLVEMLHNIEHLLSCNLVITSAFRCIDYEHFKGRSGTSSHCKGLAVDVSCRDSQMRLELVQAALRSGFRRIGVGETFIHIDIDSDKPSCLWLYK